MIFFDVVLKYIPKEYDECMENGENADPLNEIITKQIRSYNEKYYNPEVGKQSQLIHYLDNSKIGVAIITDTDEAFVESKIYALKDAFRHMDGISDVEVESIHEITGAEMKEISDEAMGGSLISYMMSRRCRMQGWDFYDGCGYSVEEKVVNAEQLNQDKAEQLLDGLMADKSLREEMERIYDEKNSNSFFGFPVHYRIQAGNDAAARDIMELMVRALHSRNRIPGTRLTFITDVNVTRHDKDFNKLIKNTGGTAVLMSLSGTADEEGYATDLTRTARVVADFVREYSGDTLFFLYECSGRSGFGEETIARLESNLDFICLKEGRGNAQEARIYMDRIIMESRYAGLKDDQAYEYLKRKKSYHASDVTAAFEEWSRKCLKEKAYVAYSNCVRKKRKKIAEKKDAYDELQKMVGLKDVKNLVDDMLSYYKINKEREKYVKNSDIGLFRHMVFTGNPGCAKTTVARLLADILLEEGILETGKYVECGRADLVGKYVGWTAKAVQAKFQQAKGGVLFIDEAYSLVDDSRSYGDEAINTIVQEMENHRDDVIVIFAGYPEPMKEFIDRNDGLRSRIAFHIEFPDYTEAEMLEIFNLMAKERGYRLTSECEEKCLDIFKSAVRCENFGNGRFVRNLLEHAMMRHSGRVAALGKKSHSRKALLDLVPEDFDGMKLFGDDIGRKIRIGFRAS